ncbi:MAG: N-acetylmuramoyl-L-alanine amidase [Nitrospirae bacterium]|nr:N-acetylmuramoyl-L-alanine amidase [Nitrospirota bacterium]
MINTDDRKQRTEDRKQRKTLFPFLSPVTSLLLLGLVIIATGQARTEATRVGFSLAGKNLRKTYINKIGYTQIGTKSKGPGLLITWPPLERKEVNLKQMRLAGATLPSATIRINNIPIRVYPTGAFATLLNLKKTGKNIIEVVAEDATGETRQTIVLQRRLPPTLPPPRKKKQTPPLAKKGKPVKMPSLNWNSKLPLTGLVIVIDPGHGGKFPGAVGPTGLEEKEVNLRISLALARKLKKAGAKVILTRRKDINVPLAERRKMAISQAAHILISIHNNSAAEDTNPILRRGTGVYYTFLPSLPLARTVYSHLLTTGLSPGGYHYANLAVLRSPKMLAILVEAAFLSHPEDEALLAQKDFQEKVAEAIFQGLKDFLQK